MFRTGLALFPDITSGKSWTFRAYNGLSMRVLVVEDERKVAGFLARALRENAYAVDVVDTGEKGLELALDNFYDLVLLDILLRWVERRRSLKKAAPRRCVTSDLDVDRPQLG